MKVLKGLLLVIVLFYSLAAFSSEIPLLADDIRIKNFNGNLKVTNLKGGFFIENVMGDCEVKANGGSLKIGVVEGNIIATTTAGDIRIGEVKGETRAITEAGDIIIKKAHKNVYAETQIGEIIIESGKSVMVKIFTGGDVKLFDISGHANVSAYGNILLILNENFLGTSICKLKTEVGNITIYIPENFGANLEIKTPITMNPARETRIESDFYFYSFGQKCEKSGEFFTISTIINKGGKKIDLFIGGVGNIYIKKLIK